MENPDLYKIKEMGDQHVSREIMDAMEHNRPLDLSAMRFVCPRSQLYMKLNHARQKGVVK